MSVKVLNSGGGETLLPVGQNYVIADSVGGDKCEIYSGNNLIVNELWSAITITGASTPAQKKDKLVSFFSKALATGGGGTSVGLYKKLNVAFDVAGTVDLFTTATGRGKFKLLRISIEDTIGQLVAEGATFTIGSNNPSFDNLISAGYSPTGIPTNTVLSYSTDASYNYISIAATMAVKLNITTAGSSGLIGDVYIEGFYENDYAS
jgi:hypothetical protein